MTSHPLYSWMLVLIQVCSPTVGSLHRIQFHHESATGNAMAIARCAVGVTRALFDPLNSVVVIVPVNSTTDASATSLTSNLLGILTNDENTDRTISVHNEFGFRSHLLDVDRRMRSRDSSYLIVEDHPENLQRILDVKTIPKWSEYLILTRTTKESLRSLMTSLWQGDVLRVAFLHVNNDKDLVLRRFDEVSKNSPDLDEPKTKDSTLKCGRSFVKHKVRPIELIEPFSRLICPSRACHLRVSRVKNDLVGSAGVAESRRAFDSTDRILSVFADRYGVELRNRSAALVHWTENVDLVRADEIDLIYGSFIPRTEGLEFLDVAGWFAFETVIFVDVTQYTILGPVTKVFFPLDGYVWLCLLISLGLYSVFVAILAKAREQKFVTESIKHFDVWVLLLGQSVRIPVKIGLRAVLGMWMIASLLINAAYGCAFKSSLASFTRIETLKTINDINNSGRLIAGTEAARELFANFGDEADREIYERWKIVQPDEVFPTVMQDRIVGVDNALNVKLYNLLHRKKHHPWLYTLKDPILVYPLNFYLKKNHPCTRRLLSLVGRARASGILEKWHSEDFMNAAHLAGKRRTGRYRWTGSLGMSHMKVAFKLWFSGNIIALIVFFYELYKNRRRRGSAEAYHSRACRICNCTLSSNTTGESREPRKHENFTSETGEPCAPRPASRGPRGSLE